MGLFKRHIRTDGLTGVSLQSDGIAIARITRDKGQRPLLECLSYIDAPAAEDRNRVLRNRIDHLKLERTLCTTVLEPHDYQLLLVEAPDVPPAELKAAVRWRVKDLIGFHIDDAVLDVFEIPSQRRAGQAQTMYVIAARASTVQERINLFENSGMQLDIIDIPEMCLRNITALTEEDVQGVALLYFTPSYGLITITRQHVLYLARKIEIGSDAIRSAHQNGRESELLDSVVLEIQRSLDYYDSHFSQPPVSALLLAPCETPLPFLNEHLAQNLSVPVKNMELSSLVSFRENPDEVLEARCLPAIGAALRTESVTL